MAYQITPPKLPPLGNLRLGAATAPVMGNAPLGNAPEVPVGALPKDHQDKQRPWTPPNPWSMTAPDVWKNYSVPMFANYYQNIGDYAQRVGQTQADFKTFADVWANALGYMPTPEETYRLLIDFAAYSNNLQRTPVMSDLWTYMRQRFAKPQEASPVAYMKMSEQ